MSNTVGKAPFTCNISKVFIATSNLWCHFCRNRLAVLQTAQVAGGRGFGATWYCDNTNGRICGAPSASDAPCFRE